MTTLLSKSSGQNRGYSESDQGSDFCACTNVNNAIGELVMKGRDNARDQQ